MQNKIHHLSDTVLFPWSITNNSTQIDPKSLSKSACKTLRDTKKGNLKCLSSWIVKFYLLDNLILIILKQFAHTSDSICLYHSLLNHFLLHALWLWKYAVNHQRHPVKFRIIRFTCFKHCLSTNNWNRNTQTTTKSFSVILIIRYMRG